MAHSTVQIGEFRLAVPGISSAQASQLAEKVTRLVSEQVGQVRGGQLGRLQLRVQVPANATLDGIAAAVSDAMVKAFR